MKTRHADGRILNCVIMLYEMIWQPTFQTETPKKPIWLRVTINFKGKPSMRSFKRKRAWTIWSYFNQAIQEYVCIAGTMI